MKQYLLFLRDDILRRIGKLPFGIVCHYIWLWCTSVFFLHKANLHYALCKHHYLISYLDKYYGHLVPLGELTEINLGGQIENLPIWVFWYQGEESMPELVKCCYRSICNNSNGRKVILLTERNLTDYVDIPEYIKDKVKKRYITITHLSDLVRVELLYKYGGTWMDATLFVNAPIDNSKSNGIFGTVKIHPLTKGTISDYRWTSFYMFAYPGSLAMKCFRDVMYAFWEKNRAMLDYFFIDYTFELLYQKNINFKSVVDGNPYIHQHIFDCQINETFTGQFKKEWSDTHIFKLNRRNVIDESKVDSIYNRVIRNE